MLHRYGYCYMDPTIHAFVDTIERAISAENGAWVSDWNQAAQGG